ncbi:hypothetical protein LJR016_005055 [Devosia sp. LjRoot16]|uniref:hypothetical protein n=1 Tax=Devosia sp. LjRoot16 TaxID=3342271 RepID=UPI003ECFD363
MRVISTGRNGMLNATGVEFYRETEQVAIETPTVQLRWMTQPEAGMPVGPFRVYHENDHRPGLKAQLANDDGMWELIEECSLPIMDGAYEQARHRLDYATVPSLEGWSPIDRDAYLDDVVRGRLGEGLRDMLASGQPHYSFAVNPPERFELRALTEGAFAAAADRSSGTWYPWRVALLAAATDPWASLALGFGTATPIGNETLSRYMITAEYEFSGRRLEFADIVDVSYDLPRPHPATGLEARVFQVERGGALDAFGVDVINVMWDRPPHAQDTVGNAASRFACGHAIVRREMYHVEAPVPNPDVFEYLNLRRLQGGGYVPLAAGLAPGNDKLMAVDRIPRRQTSGAPGYHYQIAVGDIFGRWADIAAETIVASPPETPCAPELRSVQLGSDGSLVVEFSWDWKERSPKFIELSGAFRDGLGSGVFGAAFKFEEGAQEPAPVAGVELTALSPLFVPCAFGAEQDAALGSSGTRFYRARTVLDLEFFGVTRRWYEVVGRGQAFMHARELVGFNISPWSAPKSVEVIDPEPPPVPALAASEVPLWASLPDPSGISRVHLSWAPAQGAAGYAVYEASETALLIRLDQPSRETTASLLDRLRVLRGADLAGAPCRTAFRRVNVDLIDATQTSYELELPKGSKVLHLITVVAIGHNNIESAWPATSEGCLAYAVPRLRPPAAPSLEARLEDGKVKLRVEAGADDIGGRISIHRLIGGEGQPEIGWMERLLPAPVEINAAVTLLEDTPPPRPEQHRLWYRAVAWSKEDGGKAILSSASAPSAAVGVLVPGILPDPEIFEWDGSFQPGDIGIVRGRHFRARDLRPAILLERTRPGEVQEGVHVCWAVGFTDTEISFTVPDIPEPGATYQVTVVRGDGVEVVAEDTLIVGGL